MTNHKFSPMMKKILLCMGILFILYGTTFTQVLSEWRNIGRTGIYTETDLMNKWPENGPQLIWANEDIPVGYSSIAISDSTIFLTGTDKEMDVLISIDIKGNLMWKTSYGRAWNKSYALSRCTPTVEKDRVYVSSGLGDIACINALSGEIIWKIEAMEKFDGTYVIGV